jgi:hypothetical protein
MGLSLSSSPNVLIELTNSSTLRRHSIMFSSFVGHGVMVLALMSKKANMINGGHGIMVLALMSRISIWYCHYMSLRS